MSPVITARALTKSYDKAVPILRGIDLTIRAGERVALIGPNGCGKSTFLKCLICLHPISGGAVEVLGERFSGTASGAQRRRLRRKAGFVFQKHCLVRRLSVLSNVIHGHLGEPGSWRGVSHTIAPGAWRRQAMAALEAGNLADRALDRADTLSGGQQQRVAIARGLVRQPQLLMADEPAASLDPAAGREVMSLFAKLCRDHNITLLFTSHDMAHAVRYSDRVVALKDGVVRMDLPSHEVSETTLQDHFDGWAPTVPKESAAFAVPQAAHG